jgi:tRNA-uridine 2-sulfurtransferase
MHDIDWALQRIEQPRSKGLIVVGMSGGVDSSVSAAVLKHLGYDVVGLFMKNWEEAGQCTAEEDAQDVAKVAASIGIPFYTVSFTKEYWDSVFTSFLDDLKNGLTPNPDILCNREVKFKRLLEKAVSIGGTPLATGHYASCRERDGRWYLERAADETKDQSYFLYTATQESLSRTVFPLGKLRKTEVRAIAKTLGLAVAEKKDSTGICFIGERKLKDFLRPYLGYTEGNIITTDGHVVGTHIGLAYYTIGQRKGLGIGGEGEAWFVVGKDVGKNNLIVAQGVNHPALFASALVAKEPHWINEMPQFPLTCTAKIRYRQEDQPCTVRGDAKSVQVHFTTPQRAITPQQSIVFYDANTCLGGAFIEKSGSKGL